MMITFLTILAWIGFIGGLLLTAGRIFAFFTTTDLERLVARMDGKVITHPIKTSGTIMIVCGAFLLAKALS
jgi:hypothetical protein